MGIDQYLLFLLITALFLASPGPAILLCINNGLQHGIRPSAVAVLGNVVAFQILIFLSAIGVGAVLTTSIEFYNLLKILGAIYLIYLGIKAWLSPVKTIAQQTIKKSSSHLFRQAFLLTSTNPKALVYVTALLPQFIDTQQSLVDQMITLTLSIGVTQYAVFMAYVILAHKAGNWLRNEQTRSLFNRITGVTFIGFGFALAFSETNISQKS